MLRYLRYRYAKTNMAAFVNGELPAQTRRFIGRLIDDDPRVYQEYVLHRQARQQLESHLPSLGRVRPDRLDAIWGNIQSQMRAESHLPSGRHAARSPIGYGLAVGLCIVALLFPLLFESGRVAAFAVPYELALPEIALSKTPSHSAPTLEATAVALAGQTESGAFHDPAADLQNTPEPETPGQSR